MRDFVQNFPLFSIILCLVSSSLSSLLKGKAAKWVNTFLICVVGGLSLTLTFYCIAHGSFTYTWDMCRRPGAMRCEAVCWKVRWRLSFA